jgi:ketosteroid isomerase-like protein
MSANLDLVRSIRTAWERGDYSSIDWAHPEIEFVIADGPAPGRWTGLAEMAEANRDFFSAWEDWRGEADQYHELDGERVLVLVRYSGRGKLSGLDLRQMRAEGATLFHCHDGKVTRLVNYLNRDRALVDLGLTSEGDASEASS